MKTASLRGSAAAALCASVAGLGALSGQTRAAVDLGITDVRYDGFLPSAAASVSPEFRLDGLHTFLSARGTYLRFESGNRSLQANLAGSIFSGAFGHWRAELSGHAGTSRYADFASFSHLMAGPRIHVAGRNSGAWLGGTGGASWFGPGRRPVTSVAGGGWTRRWDAIWYMSLTTTRVGDTAYTDLVGATHADRGRLSFDGSLGLRAGGRGGGHGVFGEASAAWQVGSWMALVLTGGRYPTDPTRGSVSGRYIGLAMRFTALSRRTSAVPEAIPDPLPLHTSGSPAGDFGAVRASVDTRACACGGRTLLLHAVVATLVEVTGDFTDWEPVTLELDPSSTWVLPFPLSSGTYRFTVRIDGGDWFVPAGATSVRDEYGGLVGLLTVP
jgi:hypothetical protein